MSSEVIFRSAVKGLLSFHCPGCGHSHVVYLSDFYAPDDKGPTWQFNGDFVQPTLSSSVLCLAPTRCHLFVRDGQLQYLDDCEHTLRGQVVPMVPRTPEEEAKFSW